MKTFRPILGVGVFRTIEIRQAVHKAANFGIFWC